MEPPRNPGRFRRAYRRDGSRHWGQSAANGDSGLHSPTRVEPVNPLAGTRHRGKTRRRGHPAADADDLDIVTNRRLRFVAEHRGIDPSEFPTVFVEVTRNFLDRHAKAKTSRSWIASEEGTEIGSSRCSSSISHRGRRM